MREAQWEPLPILTMKYPYKTILMMLAILLPASSTILAQQRELPFQAGEKAQIIIHYKYGPKMDIGKMDIAVTEKSGLMNVRADISTYSFWDKFYKVRDVYETTFTKDGIVPVKAYRDVHEGDFWARSDYDWRNGGRTLHAVVDKKNRPHRDTVYNESKPVRDVMNLFFAIRALDIDKLIDGKVAHQIVAMDKDLLNVKLKFFGREEKKISGLGTFRTIKLGVTVNARNVEEVPESDKSNFSIAAEKGDGGDENVFYGNSKIFIWVSDDENHMPLFFSAPVKVGSINGRLADFSGLKYPMTSKIE